MRFDDFKIATRDHTIEQPTADARTIRQAAGQCLKRAPLDKRLRLLGVRVGSLVKLADLQNFKLKEPAPPEYGAQTTIDFESFLN